MKSLQDTFTLQNGVKIPCIGFGTWKVEQGPGCVQAVREAIRMGYRHIDTAAAYGNERSVGEGVRSSGVAREDIFVTSKLANSEHGYERTVAAFEQTMAELGLDYLDLYLIHWPRPKACRDNWEEANAGTWKAFEEFYKAGRIKALGLSNFMPKHMIELAKTATVAPMVNQIEFHPGCIHEDIYDYCRKNDILIEAWSPLASGKVFQSQTLQDLAAKYGKSVAQLCVRWCLQLGALPLPKSVQPERICSNTQVFDFEIAPDDMQAMTQAVECGTGGDPDNMPF